MKDELPKHIGYIVDGNRRWAKHHGLPTYEGHLAGYNAIQDVAAATFDAGVSYMSAYVFSTENWKRSQTEVKRLMGLVLKLVSSDLHIFSERNIRLRIVGTRDGLNEKLLQAIEKAELETANNTAGTLALCFNYGGQLEIVDAVKQIVQNNISPEDITSETIAEHLYAPDIPPCDLIVRTSGEQRLSNFMLWRSAYSELMFLDKNWPDMTKQDVTDILEEYKRRGRRFGG
ncbi:MAG: Di-trans,poly-cis-decaprenylcistransferase [Patescibacteria group bacterium]|nr:Di-trans,poly-cis-decaprenylcistransferase [Patescibacteria group bacterium]